MRHNPDDLQHTIYRLYWATISFDERSDSKNSIRAGPCAQQILASNADRELSSKHTGARAGRALDEVQANYDYILLDAANTHTSQSTLCTPPTYSDSYTARNDVRKWPATVIGAYRRGARRVESSLQIAGAVAMMVHRSTPTGHGPRRCATLGGKRGIRHSTRLSSARAQFSNRLHQREWLLRSFSQVPNQAYREFTCRTADGRGEGPAVIGCLGGCKQPETTWLMPPAQPTATPLLPLVPNSWPEHGAANTVAQGAREKDDEQTMPLGQSKGTDAGIGDLGQQRQALLDLSDTFAASVAGLLICRMPP